jgi:hypothetical protein
MIIKEYVEIRPLYACLSVIKLIENPLNPIFY